MASRSGVGSVRSDCKHFATCGEFSMYHCRMYCRHQDRHPYNCKLTRSGLGIARQGQKERMKWQKNNKKSTP